MKSYVVLYFDTFEGLRIVNRKVKQIYTNMDK
jgi:hypothetical protein